MIAGLVLLFAFLNGIPWASRHEVEQLRTEKASKDEVSAIDTAIREIQKDIVRT